MNKKSNERYKVDLPRLKELIDSQKSRQVIADAIGIDVSTITKQYNEQKGVTLDSLVRYAKYFNVTTDYLLGLTDVKEPPNSDEDKTLRIICDSTGLSEEAARKLTSFEERRKENDYAYYDYFPSANLINYLSVFICSDEMDEVSEVASELLDFINYQPIDVLDDVKDSIQLNLIAGHRQTEGNREFRIDAALYNYKKDCRQARNSALFSINDIVNSFIKRQTDMLIKQQCKHIVKEISDTEAIPDIEAGDTDEKS